MDEIVLVVLGSRRWEIGAVLCRNFGPGRVRPGEVVVWDGDESSQMEGEVEGRWSWPEVRVVVIPSVANSSISEVRRLAESIVTKKASALVLNGVLMAVDEGADESASWKLGRQLQAFGWPLGCVRFAIPSMRGEDSFEDDGRIEEAASAEEEARQMVVASITTNEEGEAQAALEVCAAVARAAARDTTAFFASLPLDLLLFDALEPESHATELPVVSRRRPRPRQVLESTLLVTQTPSAHKMHDLEITQGTTPLLRAAQTSSLTEEDPFAETDPRDEEPFWRHFIGDSDEDTAGALARAGCVVCWRDSGHRLDRPFRISLALRDHAAEDQRLAVRSVRIAASCDCSPFPPKPKSIQHIATDDDSGERGGIVLRAIHRRCTPGRHGDWRDLDSGAAFPSLGAWLAALVADIPLRDALPGALLTKTNRLISAAKTRGLDPSLPLPHLADALLATDFCAIDHHHEAASPSLQREDEADTFHWEEKDSDPNTLLNSIPAAFSKLEKSRDTAISRAALLQAFPPVWRDDAEKLHEIRRSASLSSVAA